MKNLVWSEEKNQKLLKERGVSFDQLIHSKYIGIEKNRARPGQLLMLFEFNKYIWVVPYVESVDQYFLKTAFPSRKHTKKYLMKGFDEKN